MSRQTRGFLEREIADLSAVSDRLSIAADIEQPETDRENVLIAYLGPQTGRKVLAGQIRRGQRENCGRALSSDLRRFTQVRSTLRRERHQHAQRSFDCRRGDRAAGRRDSEIIGDGLLAIFPSPTRRSHPHRKQRARRGARGPSCARRPAVASAERGEIAVEIVIALTMAPSSTAMSSGDRLDFTVIGPAVNLVSRIETMPSRSICRLIVSDDSQAPIAER